MSRLNPCARPANTPKPAWPGAGGVNSANVIRHSYRVAASLRDPLSDSVLRAQTGHLEDSSRELADV